MARKVFGGPNLETASVGGLFHSSDVSERRLALRKKIDRWSDKFLVPFRSRCSNRTPAIYVGFRAERRSQREYVSSYPRGVIGIPVAESCRAPACPRGV